MRKGYTSPKPVPPPDLWQQLFALEERLRPSKQPGWFSAEEYQKERGLKSRTARARLREMRDAGLVEIAGQIRQTIYYKIK